MTRAELKASIRALGYTTGTDTHQNEAINTVIRRVAGMRRWPWQESATSNASLTVGASIVGGLPTDLLHLDSVRAEVGTEYDDLEYMAPEELRRRLHIDRTNGVPQFWTYWNRSIVIYPRANRAYTITIDYVKKPSILAQDTDVAEIPDTYHDLIKWGVATQLAYRERDWDEYNAARGEYKTQVEEMLAEVGVKQRQTARRVVRSGVWDAGALVGPGGI